MVCSTQTEGQKLQGRCAQVGSVRRCLTCGVTLSLTHCTAPAVHDVGVEAAALASAYTQAANLGRATYRKSKVTARPLPNSSVKEHLRQPLSIRNHVKNRGVRDLNTTLSSSARNRGASPSLGKQTCKPEFMRQSAEQLVKTRMRIEWASRHAQGVVRACDFAESDAAAF
jgi:hypothetical protein